MNRVSIRRQRSTALDRQHLRHRVQVELLESRILLYHGPIEHADGSLEVEMDVTFDQFGFQPAMFQAYENQVDFSIFDTGASVVTFSATSQFFFQFFGGTGIPIKVPCGAAAEGVGGVLTGHVSQPGEVQADGLHIANLTFDNFGFPVFELEFDPATAAIVPDIQAFVGALIGSEAAGGCPAPASEFLPTITGTPMLNPTAANPNGLAVVVRPQGELLDFSDFPELNGLVLPVPDISFQQPGLGVPSEPTCTQPNPDGTTRYICTDPVRMAVEFVGLDNHMNPGDSITESFNPVHNHVTLENDSIVISDQVYLFDTGAQLSIISTEAALTFGLDLDNPETIISVQGAAGAVHDIPGFTIDRISIPLASGGDLIFTNVPIYVLDVATGLLDGILGMNLFNNAAVMVYDPFHPDGPSLDLTFYKEHLFGIFGSAVPEDEPNDTPANATKLLAGQYGVGEIDPITDTDWWVVENVKAGDLVFSYVDTQNSTTSLDSMLRIVADDGTTLAEADDNDGPGLSSTVAGAAISQPGRVYFHVSEPNGNTITQYELYQAVISPTDSASETEGNNSTSDADPILKSIMNGSIVPGSGDVDYFSFVATSGSRIVVIMDNDPDGDSLLTHNHLSILHPNGTVLQTGDNAPGADGNAAGAVVSAPTSGTYFVRIADTRLGLDDDYRFTVLVLDGGDPLAGAVLMFNVLHAQAQAEETVDNCLLDIFVCDFNALSSALDFLLNVSPVLAFAGTIGAGLLPVGFDSLTMTSSIQTLTQAEEMLLNCLLDPLCDFDAVLDQLNDLINEDLTPGSVNMIQGGRLPAFTFPDSTIPTVTLNVPGLTNDSTPSVIVTAQDDGGLPNGTPVRIDVDLNGDSDFSDPGEMSYRTATLIGGSAQVDVTPALTEGLRHMRARVTDSNGNEGTSATHAVLIDLSAPVISNMPTDKLIEATSAAGAVATYSTPNISDNFDPNPVLTCLPTSGTTYPLGVSKVTCNGQDDAGNASSREFTVTVRDTTAPLLSNMPANRTVEATGANGAAVTFTLPTATDLVDASPNVNCGPASGSTFPIGTTKVNCSAVDDAGNSSAAEFSITVRDTTAPLLSNIPTNRTVEATGANGAAVTFTPPTATDLVDASPNVNCGPASGTTFPIGTTKVNCSAVDDAGNSSAAEFSITVRDTTAPVLANMPPDHTVNATSANGAVVTFTPPTATDLVDASPNVNCNPASGSTFPIGTTKVNCSAVDDAGNSSAAEFSVTVQSSGNSGAPVISNMPGNQTVEAISAAGAPLNYPLPTASSPIDPAPRVECNPGPGSTFSLGMTTVTCMATDNTNNSSSAMFNVTVRDTTPPAIAHRADIVTEATEPFGAFVHYDIPTTFDAVSGTGLAQCDMPPGNFPIGQTEVECHATDAAGNQAAPTTFTVNVTTAAPVIDFSGGTLTVLGTVQDDTIRLLKAGRGIRVQTNFGELTIPNRKALANVVIDARGGNDNINLALLSSKQSARVDGGSGDDAITTGAGNDIILGGLGRDYLFANKGDNILIGGAGDDRLIGSRGSDILIGGSLDPLAGSIDLPAVLAAWRSRRTAGAKQAAIQQVVDRVLDDGDRDILIGKSGIDLFTKGLADEFSDAKKSDLQM